MTAGRRPQAGVPGRETEGTGKVPSVDGEEPHGRRDGVAYLGMLRAQAQSILAGVQRLEDQRATRDDDAYAGMERALDVADCAVWGTVDWIEADRADV